jgi:cytochrome c oxidase subunit 2
VFESIYQFIKGLFEGVGGYIGHWVPQASSFAADVDALIGLVAVLAGFWFVVAQGVFFWLIFRYRRRPGQRGQYITGQEKNLVRFVAWPDWAIIACDIIIVFAAIMVWVKIKQDFPEPDRQVRVISQQWAWTFVHPGPDEKFDTEDDIRSFNEMHVEVDKTYHYDLESLDVLHDFSVPVFRLKQDAIPGRVVKGWFKPTKTGTWDIQCAEMCGIGHGIMGARIVIESPEEHAAWIEQNSSGKLASAGSQ